jgi:hypothetical protein
MKLKNRYCRNRKNVKGADKVFRKETLDSLAPEILGPSSPTKLEKNYEFKLCSALVIIALSFVSLIERKSRLARLWL